MPSITNTDNLVSLSAITTNSTTGCLLPEGITSLRSRKKRWREGGEASLAFVISRQRKGWSQLEMLLVAVPGRWPVGGLLIVGTACCLPRTRLPPSQREGRGGPGNKPSSLYQRSA